MYEIVVVNFSLVFIYPSVKKEISRLINPQRSVRPQVSPLWPERRQEENDARLQQQNKRSPEGKRRTGCCLLFHQVRRIQHSRSRDPATEFQPGSKVCRTDGCLRGTKLSSCSRSVR